MKNQSDKPEPMQFIVLDVNCSENIEKIVYTKMSELAKIQHRSPYTIQEMFHKFLIDDSQLYLKVIAQIKIWLIQRMYVYKLKTHIPSIFIKISHINFTHLYHIDIGDNNISNIEALAFLNTPKLQYLGIEKNPIISLKTLRKCSFSQLRNLHLLYSKFSFQQLTHLTRMKVSKGIRHLIVSTNQNVGYVNNFLGKVPELRIQWQMKIKQNLKISTEKQNLEILKHSVDYRSMLKTKIITRPSMNGRKPVIRYFDN